MGGRIATGGGREGEAGQEQSRVCRGQGGEKFSVTPLTAAREASLSITNSWSLFKLMPIESVIPSDHLVLCCPLLLLSVPYT